MRFFPKLLSRAESDDLLNRCQKQIDAQGFGLMAVELTATGGFIGLVGVCPTSFEASFTPAMEVAWRLARPFWGMGYATEAASAAMRHGFEEHALTEILSLTAMINRPSIAVMQRLGMTPHAQRYFDHPKLPPGHPLRRHVLYRSDAAAHVRLRGGET